MNDEGKSLLFLILSLTCAWLILDMMYGKKYIDKLVNAIFAGTVTDSTHTKEEKNNDSTNVKKNNSTNSGATNNISFPWQSGDEQRDDAIKNDNKNNSTGSSSSSGSINFNPGNSSSTSKPSGNTTGGNSSSFPH